MGSLIDDNFPYNGFGQTQQVTLSGFWIYTTEVTVAQYLAFCTATDYPLPIFPSAYYWEGISGWTDPAVQQFPIVDVSWNDAQAYATWAGISLPTEAQYEYAARGSQGKNYPWGGMATMQDPDNGWEQIMCANDWKSRAVGISTWPVGSFPQGASWCGAEDLAGNVWEWCADRYGNYSSTPVTNPTGPATGTNRVLRGGAWDDNCEDDFRGACRNNTEPEEWSDNLGFRCVLASPGTTPAPTITSFTPTSGGMWTVVTITGTGFYGTTSGGL